VTEIETWYSSQPASPGAVRPRRRFRAQPVDAENAGSRSQPSREPGSIAAPWKKAWHKSRPRSKTGEKYNHQFRDWDDSGLAVLAAGEQIRTCDSIWSAGSDLKVMRTVCRVKAGSQLEIPDTFRSGAYWHFPARHRC